MEAIKLTGKDSLDYVKKKGDFLFLFIIYGIIFVISLFVGAVVAIQSPREVLIVVWTILGLLGFYILLFTPFLIVYAARMKKTARINDLVFQKAVLSDLIDDSFGRRVCFHFSVAIEIDGKRTIVDTDNIFFPKSLYFPALETYMNKTVTVGYSPSTNRLLVFPLPKSL